MAEQKSLLGWDVGGTKCSVVVGTPQGLILTREEWPTRDVVGHQQMIHRFLDTARRFEKDYGKFSGLGVSIGGPLNMRTGVILSPPHLSGWDNVPLKEILFNKLSASLITESAPIIVQHDAAACLCAEALWGAAQGATHAIYLTCGTGCGCGIMIDGQILMGPNGESPEIGFAKLSDTGPSMDFCGISQSAHVEIYGSGTGISKLASYMYPKEFSPEVECQVISTRAQSGDLQAKAVLNESANRIGQLCVTLTTLFSPQYILLGSLARYLGSNWLDTITSYFRRHALPSNSTNTKILAAALGNRLQDLSALAPAVLALQQKNQ